MTAQQPRPRGAPAMGQMVALRNLDGTYSRGPVVMYLSSQFVIETRHGRRVVGMKEDWKILAG